MRNPLSLKHTFCLSMILLLFACFACESDNQVLDETLEEVDNETSGNAAPMILPDVHDPSQIYRINNHLVFFASGVEWNIYDLQSKIWSLEGDNIYENGDPEWYDGEEKYWAPGFVDFGSGQFRIYHSAVEDEDVHQSKIGFVALGGSPESGFSFERQNEHVLSSSSMSDAFAIDPAVFVDDDNRAWLVYGSHAAGIYTVELDVQTGLLKEEPQNKSFDLSDTRFTHLADYGGGIEQENNIEAAYIYNHPSSDYYYLFVNWDVCCSGISSTYNIRIGRSLSPTGPFLDKEGNDMRLGGGTLFMDAQGMIVGDSRFIGPGHSGIYTQENGKDYFSHHFYDGANNGMPSLAIWPLEWVNGWPEIDVFGTIDF